MESQQGKKLSQDQIDTIRRLRSEGWSIRRIAAHVGCNPRTVTRHLKPEEPRSE